MAVDPYGGTAFVADSLNCVVRAVDTSSRRSSTLAGTAGVSGFVDGRGLVAEIGRGELRRCMARPDEAGRRRTEVGLRSG